MLTKECFAMNEDEQQAMGTHFSKACQKKGAIVYLYGDLGAGKTTFVRGFMRGLGCMHRIKSPTYTLVESYEIQDRLVLHIDLYRLKEEHEVYALGITDQIEESTICFIEWPERAEKQLPPPDLACYISPFGEGRRLYFVASTSRGDALLLSMADA